ncbi:MAG TPA: bifunctional oligoribonuclease/PAP phosphatase NrnA, partial [Deltaproteobacteria bacterium]|nr:bifunctional oligoribonuclease/PAP phosphatase NrnA [Deltaproteobacteria bacterium]
MTNEQEAARYAVERLLRERWSFEVITHQQPDEDAGGSARGLGLALASMGKAVRVVFPTPIPENLDFTEGPH